jgi:hypothetical protein
MVVGTTPLFDVRRLCGPALAGGVFVGALWLREGHRLRVGPHLRLGRTILKTRCRRAVPSLAAAPETASTWKSVRRSSNRLRRARRPALFAGQLHLSRASSSSVLRDLTYCGPAVPLSALPGIADRDLSDEHGWRGGRATERSRTSSPQHAASCPMPAQDRGGLNERDRGAPTRSETGGEGHPETAEGGLNSAR